MIKTLNPYPNTAKTAEIMSRYRPIAPKPESPPNSMSDNKSMSQKISQSPYLRNLWPQLQARPTRTRKRGRAAPIISHPSFKRTRTHHVLGLTTPSHVTSPAQNLSLQGFTHGLPLPNLASVNCSLENSATPSSSLVTLPLLPCSPSLPVVMTNLTTTPELNCMEPTRGEKGIDLNRVAEIPEEKDLLQQLQGPHPTRSTATIIAPQPVRPVGSSISVGCINVDPGSYPAVELLPKKPEEVEEEVESDALPAVISDSNHRVRLANSAYKEMVGQPECSWLDSMMTSGDGRMGCTRICGEVMLHLSDSRVPVSSNGFSCWVRIEWGSNEKKNSINAFCDVIRLSCQSKDYLFTWRFHTHATSRKASQSSCNV